MIRGRSLHAVSGRFFGGSMRILYEDGYFLICEKPAGAISQGGEDDMVKRVSEYLGGVCYPVHRLDRGTGGLLALAKTRGAAARLSELFRERGAEKEYLAVIRGAPEAEAGEYRDLLFRDASKNKSYVVKRMRKGVKEASLSYRTVARAADMTMVRVTLRTGRTHQIRVQFASRGTPLVGDGKYGGGQGGNIALWSHVLRFDHPFTGEPVSVTLPPPESWPWTAFAR